MLRPSPVGACAGGATPEGVHDLAGNVWEWTLSLYQPYPYQVKDGRNDPETDGLRVVRGGLWNDTQWGARCTVRDGYEPGYFDNYLGFRVVMSLSDSG